MMPARRQPAVIAFLPLAAYRSTHEWFPVTASETRQEASLFFFFCCHAEMLGVALRKNLL